MKAGSEVYHPGARCHPSLPFLPRDLQGSMHEIRGAKRGVNKSTNSNQTRVVHATYVQDVHSALLLYNKNLIMV